MANNLTIECADRSVRWYLTPGQTSRYEIIVINQSGDETVDCVMSLDDPPKAGTFEPASFRLRPRERRTVALTFGEEAQVPRDQRTLISVRDQEDIVIASLERGLISAGGTDCTIQLAWKEPILDGDDVRGFVVSCAIKSLSSSPGEFALQFTPHPSLEFVDVTPTWLQPGQTTTVAVPILWKRSVKDPEGNNHPRVVEIGVAVSQGKRTGRLQWDTVEARLAELAKNVEPVEPPAQPLAPPVLAPPAASAAASAASSVPADDAAYQTPLFELPDAGTPPATIAASSALAIPSPILPVFVQAVQQPTTAIAAPAAAASAQPAALSQPAAQASTPSTPSTPSASSTPSAPATPAPSAPAEKPAVQAHDVERLEGDAALMSLLVGKPVAPPAGWRGPDTPPVPPPSIFARTPPAVAPQPQPQPRQTPPDPTPPSSASQPYRRAPVAPAASVGAASHAPASPAVDPGIEVAEAPPVADPLEALEASVVGPPPSLTRTLESGREFAAANPRRTVDFIEPEPSPSESKMPTFVIGGTALLAALLGAFLILRPQVAPPQAQPQATPAAAVPPAVVFSAPAPVPSRAGAVIGAQPGANASNRPGAQPTVAASAAARVAAQATQRAVAPTSPASTPKPAPRPSAVALAPKAVHKPAPHPKATHRPIPPSKNTIVAMVQGVDAHYGPQGHAVRIVWGANGQASAHVALQDDKGSVLSETDVAGTRQTALLYVPRSYRGPVFVQVISQGASGERVTQSAQLPAYSR